MNFGQAIEAMKAGKSVRREGWNGKGMHVYLEDGGTMFKGHSTQRTYEPVFCLYNAQGNHQPGWNASQPDMLAEDWECVA